MFSNFIYTTGVTENYLLLIASIKHTNYMIYLIPETDVIGLLSETECRNFSRRVGVAMEQMHR